MTCGAKNDDDSWGCVPRMANYEALCRQLVECLNHFEHWLVYCRDGEGGNKCDLRYGREIIKVQIFRNQVLGFIEFVRPQPTRVRHGFEVFDGEGKGLAQLEVVNLVQPDGKGD